MRCSKYVSQTQTGWWARRTLSQEITTKFANKLKHYHPGLKPAPILVQDKHQAQPKRKLKKYAPSARHAGQLVVD